MAQEFAEGCSGNHGNPARDTPPFHPIGQNIWLASYVLPADTSRAVKAWYNEKPYYNYDSVSCDANKVCGHYTQVNTPTQSDKNNVKNHNFNHYNNSYTTI